MLIVGLLSAALVPLPKGGAPAAPAPSIVSRAARLLGHESPRQVMHWLRSQPSVSSAQWGRDGRTLDLTLRDGQSELILPALTRTIALTPPAPLHHRTALSNTNPTGRALILEPFATELGLGSGGADVEIADLQDAGFSVTSAYDSQVTVDTFATLPDYNVVYMHTHSGVDPAGVGVLASGQQTRCVRSSNADGSVVAVGVAGSDLCYLAITSRYITAHMDRLPAHSLLFLNGCSLLNSNEFMHAVLAQGAGVVLSWNNDATARDGFLAGGTFFNAMAGGQSVSSAVQTLIQDNNGTSTYDGQTATLGFRGDGSITLAEAAKGGIAPTLVPTSTAVPPTATSTPLPPTATPTPAPPTPTATPTATLIPPVTPNPHRTKLTLTFVSVRSLGANGAARTAFRYTDPLFTEVVYRVRGQPHGRMRVTESYHYRWRAGGRTIWTQGKQALHRLAKPGDSRPGRHRLLLPYRPPLPRSLRSRPAASYNAVRLTVSVQLGSLRRARTIMITVQA